MERRKIIFEDQVRKALLDGILDNSEKEDLEELRKRFGMSKRRADALVAGQGGRRVFAAGGVQRVIKESIPGGTVCGALLKKNIYII